MIKLTLASVLVAVLSTGLMLAFGSSQATAAECIENGRQCNYGWFTNQGPVLSGHRAFTPVDRGLKANSKWDLFGGIGGSMLCINAGQRGSTFGVPQNDQNATAAAFIVLTMLGERPGTPKNRACERWNDWTDLIHQYDAAGRINYNIMHNFQCINTFYDGGSSDMMMYRDCGEAASIVFYAADGTALYSIKRDCGNPTGRFNALPPIRPPDGSINPPTGNPPGRNTEGVNYAVNSSCARVTGWARDYNNPSYAVPVTISYRVGNGQPITMPATSARNSAPHAFGQDTPPEVRTSTQPIQVTATGRGPDGASFSLGGSTTIGPCRAITAACNGISWDPASLDPGSPYRITARINYGNAADATAILAQPGGVRFFMTIQGPGVNRSLTNVTPVTNAGNGIVRATTPTQPPTGQSGTYEVSYGIVAASGSITCSGNGPVNPGGTFPVYSKPYFQVTNGDLSAGAGMGVGGTNCAVSRNPDAGIVSWNRGASGAYGGAGTKASALALGRLQGFATGQGSSLAPDGAAFANNADGQVNTAGGLFGGRFGGTDCTSDYFAGVPAGSVQTGNVTIGTLSIPNCTGSNGGQCRRTVYIRGNAYITGNITFAGSNSGFASAASVPSFSLVVSGNIYIAPGVTQLDGFYIAQPTTGSSSNGVVYTCAPAPFMSAALDRNLQTNCGQQLTVNGSFVGRQVWLLRTSGSIGGAAAEVFNYSPEAWLSAPYGNDITGGAGEYDAITSLPPVL